VEGAGRWASVAELAHELRESLSTIMLWEQILRMSDDEKVRARAIDAIRDCARAQARVIDDLVQLGKRTND
jgi:signal transduction histidine kinase